MSSTAKVLTISYINNQYGTPADLKTIVSKNAGWEKVEGNIRICSKLERLDLDSNSLSTIGPVFDLPLLSNLSVAHNRIVDLTGIYRLGYLKQLNVSHNQLTNLDALTACTELRVLIANNNHLTRLPIPLPKYISTLILSHNELKDLEGIETCTYLTKLSASHNAITQLPQGILALTKLSELRVNHNLLTTLPGNAQEFGQKLGRMKLLDLGNNRFTELDPLLQALLPMNFLRNLNLKGCPIEKRGQPLVEDPTIPQGPNAHFLHTSALAAASAAAANAAASATNPAAGESSSSSAVPAASNISVSPSTVNPSNSVSAPTHPPAYFLAIRKSMPLLAILDTKKLTEHEIQFRQIAEGGKGGGIHSQNKRDKKLKLMTDNKTGLVVQKTKGMKRNQQHRGKTLPLPTLTELEKGVTMQSKKKDMITKKREKSAKTSAAYVPPQDSDGFMSLHAPAASSASSASSPHGSPSFSSSSKKKSSTLPLDLQAKNAQRKLNRREKKQQALLNAQLSSGGEGSRQAQEQMNLQYQQAREKKAAMKKSPLTAAHLPAGRPRPTSATASPTAPVAGEKRKREDASASEKKNQPPQKKPKAFSTMEKKQQTLNNMNAHQHQQQQSTPIKSQAQPSQPPKQPKSPKNPQSSTNNQPKQSPKSTSHHHPNESIGATGKDETHQKKQKISSGVASPSVHDGVVNVVRTGSSSFSVDALNHAFAKSDHVGEAASGGWTIDATPAASTPSHGAPSPATKKKHPKSPKNNTPQSTPMEEN